MGTSREKSFTQCLLSHFVFYSLNSAWHSLPFFLALQLRFLEAQDCLNVEHGGEEGRCGLVHRHLQSDADLVLAVGIFSSWHPMAVLGILLRSRLIRSLQSQMYPPCPNFKDCSGLRTPLQPFWAHAGSRENKGHIQVFFFTFLAVEKPQGFLRALCLLFSALPTIAQHRKQVLANYALVRARQ